jgi:hypothetical protein
LPTLRKSLAPYNLAINYSENVFLWLPKAKVMIDTKIALNKNVCFKLTKCLIIGPRGGTLIIFHLCCEVFYCMEWGGKNYDYILDMEILV